MKSLENHLEFLEFETGCIFPRKLTWLAGKSTIFNSIYIFNWLEFSIVMLVFGGGGSHTSSFFVFSKFRLRRLTLDFRNDLRESHYVIAWLPAVSRLYHVLVSTSLPPSPSDKKWLKPSKTTGGSESETFSNGISIREKHAIPRRYPPGSPLFEASNHHYISRKSWVHQMFSSYPWFFLVAGTRFFLNLRCTTSWSNWGKYTAWRRFLSHPMA